MFNDFAGFVIFALATTYTPGPNNISSMAFSLVHGFRGTLRYMLGIISGIFFVLLLLSALMFYVSSSALDGVLDVMRYVGGGYILYLAWKSYAMNLSWEDGGQEGRHRFRDGVFFQFVNPKFYFFAITMLSVFVDYSNVKYMQLVALSATMITITFSSLALWALAGALLKRLLLNDSYRRAFGIVMALSLVYTAYRIVF